VNWGTLERGPFFPSRPSGRGVVSHFRDILYLIKKSPSIVEKLHLFSSRLILRVISLNPEHYAKVLDLGFKPDQKRLLIRIKTTLNKFLFGSINIETLLGNIIKFFRKPRNFALKGVNRSIVTFPDGLGKNRIIALGDYLTQITLKPLHKLVMGLLKGIKEDYTFDQNRSIKVGKQIFLDKKVSIYSLDLSQATDRLPIVLQALVLRLVFDKKGSNKLGEA